MKRLILTLVIILNSFYSYGQTNDEVNKDVAMPSAVAIANHLRLNYGMTQAAYLTQMAWEFSRSFASVDQLQQQWLQALETEVFEHQQFNHINTHALMAQTLIQFSNGMSLNRWRLTDLSPPPQLPAIGEGLTPDQVFQIWLNLPYFWQQIIKNQPQQTVQWLKWPDATLKANQFLSIEKQADLPLVLSWLNKKAPELTVELAKTDAMIEYYDNLSVALIRQHHHMQQGSLLAFANDWIEIYQLIELSPSLLTSAEQKNLAKLIDQSMLFWEQNLDQIQSLDARLHPILKLLLLELPNKFKNPDHINPILNQQILGLAFDVEDMASYMNHPVRENIQKNLEVCLNLSVMQSPEPNLPIADKQFESCFDDLFNWANETAKDPILAGNKVRLDNPTSLHRALELPSLQIINILNMQAVTDENCQQQIETQANLFEWLLATETLAWFHDRWPGIFADKNKNDEFKRLISMGKAINNHPPCFNQSDALANQYITLKSKWERLKQEIKLQIDLYEKNELIANSDINLFDSIEQKTNHIPDGLVIKPCDISQSCGAYVELDPSLKLMNLFPNHLKLATQFGLGEIQICYDQVQWQNRKTAPTHLDNNKISNFEGELSIQLNGLFEGNTVFSKQLISNQRHIYLFGENNQETLEMECPLSLIGKQINTTLDRGTFGLLPNRLTFLTAQKTDINAVIKNNWNTWLENIQDESTALNYFDEMNGIKTKVNDSFLKHVNQIQQQIYRKLIASNPSRINDSALSKATFEYLNQRKLINHMVTGLFPNTFQSNQAVRSALTGDLRMVDADFFRKSYDNQTNVIDMMEQGDALFVQHDAIWTESFSALTGPESGFINATLNELKQIIDFTEKQ
ncbi:hypothetical protein [Marinicella litoralis]|nr:hypothetical protein [Marinicella litoralis]